MTEKESLANRGENTLSDGLCLILEGGTTQHKGWTPLVAEEGEKNPGQKRHKEAHVLPGKAKVGGTRIDRGGRGGKEP